MGQHAHNGRMEQGLIQMADEIMIGIGLPMTVYSLTGAIREMFGEQVDTDHLVYALENESSFVRIAFREYGLNNVGRAERLAHSFGL
jgi:hypothetical protein